VRSKLIKVSRFVSYKKDAYRVQKWFEKCQGIRVEITGSRGNWGVLGMLTIVQLAKFASIEAQYEQGK
jgi:hypothetical protein